MASRVPISLMLCLLLLPTVACTKLVVWYSKENLTWDYVQNRCGGITVGKIQATPSELHIPLEVSSRYDSAICMYDPKGQVSGQWILISLKKGLCSGSAASPLVAKLPKPKTGAYEIRFQDSAALNPLIGTVNVD